MPNYRQLADFRGTLQAAFDATEGIADIVEKMHRTIQLRPRPLGKRPLGQASSDRTYGITGLVYRSVRHGIRLAGRGIDAGLAPLAALFPEGESSHAMDTYRSVINGVYGDYLDRTHNPLAVEMCIRSGGQDLDINVPVTTIKIALFVHGLCMNETHWCRDGHDHGAALVEQLGYQPLHLRYNTGLTIASNGRKLANILESLTGSRETPFDEIVIIGHSMGGLVARSACHYGSLEKHAWPTRLGKLFYLGTPHLGAPLERGGHGLDTLLELSPYSKPIARIGKSRSAGITDLRHGVIADETEHVPLLPGVKHFALAAVRAEKRSALSEHLIGDGLVPVNSALGQHRDPALALSMPKKHQWIGYKMGHIELLHRPEVYTRIGSWL